MIKHTNKMLLIAFVFLMGTWGCSSVRMTMTERSILEQQLMVHGLVRAMERIDLTQFYGKRVTLDVSGLAQEELDFTAEFLRVHLGKNGIRVVSDPKDAELNLKVLAPILAVDRSETLLGTPEFTFLGIPVPAIVLYRKVISKSLAEIEMYVYDAAEERMTMALPCASGEAKYNRYTVLFIISWIDTDLEERKDDTSIRIIHGQS
jgi:hypothetical protein